MSAIRKVDPAPADQAAALQQLAAAQIRRWRDEPVSFVRECLGLEPDPWQADVLAAFPKHRQIAGSACKGPGKTAVMSWLGWNFLLTRPHPKVPCTSITGDNLKDGLWTEFALWQKRSPILQRAFQWTKERIFSVQHPETWYASARTWPRDADPTQQANTLAGLHADYLLFLVDEVSDIPDGVVSAAEAALASGVETKLVIMGNPTRTEGPLYRAVVTNDRRNWFVVHINGDPDDPKRSPRIDLKWAREQIEKYGRDSYVVRVNILGQFPTRQADKLLDIADVEAAMQRTLAPRAWEGEARVIGADIARYGDDASTFFPRQGRMAFQVKEFRGLDTVQVGDELIRSIEKWRAHAANVDEGGVGAGTLDHCRNRGYGHKVYGVQFGMRAQEHERFENRRVEMHWRAAEWVKGGGCLPKDPLLAQELAAPIYWFDKRGRVCLEQKADIKKRIGRSPDRADGFVLTFANDFGPASALDAGGGVTRVQLPSENPFAEELTQVQLASDNPFEGGI